MDVANLHALLETVGNSPLASRRGLRESHRATERSSTSAVTDTSNADVVNTGDSSIASHAGGHLDLHVELGAGSEGDSLHAETGDVLGDSGTLEGGFAGAT